MPFRITVRYNLPNSPVGVDYEYNVTEAQLLLLLSTFLWLLIGLLCKICARGIQYCWHRNETTETIGETELE